MEDRIDFFKPRDGESDRGQRRKDPRFSMEESRKLKQLVADLGVDKMEQIASQLGREVFEVRRQWANWDSQPDWDDEDLDLLIKLWDDGMEIKEIVDKFGNQRSVEGIKAKLTMVSRRGSLRRPFDERSGRGGPPVRYGEQRRNGYEEERPYSRGRDQPRDARPPVDVYFRKREYSEIIDIAKDLCVYAAKGDARGAKDKLYLISDRVNRFLDEL